jgi:riboflavin transporter FmnP
MFEKQKPQSNGIIKSKTLGIIVSFTALTVALNFIRVPMPYLTMFLYQLGDISLLVALILFGAKPAITVTILTMIISTIFSLSPAGPIGPPYYLISVLAMFSGVLIFERIVKKKIKKNLAYSVAISTSFGIAARTIIMFPLDYFVYGFLVSLVSGLSESVSYSLVLSTMPGLILYNITVPLIMVPTSYLISKKVSKYIGANFSINV